jgi:putative ABC transport system substrate-binding protein
VRVAQVLDKSVGVVVGGVLSAPEMEATSLAVHSLAPDPEVLFARLRSVAPAVRRVFVIYDARQNGWLIRIARDAAKTQGLELVAQEATDLPGAIRTYRQVLGALEPKRDALWLPQDAVTVDEATVLPLVLEQAWNRNLVVFSSSVSHVKRGALFALYPNNLELGRSLADAALQSLTASAAGGKSIKPLRYLLAAVNVRTAGHLGLDIGDRQRYDLIFPEP